jgi:hypothetical protein
LLDLQAREEGIYRMIDKGQRGGREVRGGRTREEGGGSEKEGVRRREREGGGNHPAR